MAYATSNPPRLLVGAFAGAGNIWRYTSADATATVDGAGYITNGGNLGMKVGDFVIVVDTATPLITGHSVISVNSTAPGAVDLSNGTTIGLNTNSD
jgi:hypothetical protein